MATLKRHLRSRGFLVRTFSQLSHLVKAIDKHQPAVLILEVEPGSVTGLEGLRLARKIYPHLLVCALASPDVRAQLEETMGVEFLNQTLSAQELAARVRLLLLRHQVVQEKMQLQAKVWQTEAYLAHILDQVGEAIITTDLQGVVKSANVAAQKLLRMPAGSLLGKTLSDVRVEGAGFDNLSQVIMRTVTDDSCEGKFLLSPGPTALPVSVYIRGAIYLENLRRQGIILLLRDLTQQEAWELRLAESERLAALGQIAAGMAHEIRNPLMSIGGLLRRLDKQLSDDHPGKAYLPHILDSIRRMEDMIQEIDDYLAFVRSDDYQMERVNTAEIILAAMSRLEEIHPLQGITLSLNLSPDLWVFGNRHSLTELFFQLAHNACEAMGSEGELQLSSVRENQDAAVTITDTGKGIPLEYLTDIFQPFFTTKLTGAGMGLTKAYMIAERHQGRIDVQSQPGLGTTFSVHLPLITPRCDEEMVDAACPAQ